MKKCAAFWNHTNLRSGNRIYPCCRFKTPIQTFDGDVRAILQSNQYNILRETDVSSLTDCSKCMYEESKGKESLRQWFNKNYSTDDVELKYFEIGFDNICNLACDGCWEEWSHTWALVKNPTRTAKEVIVHTDDLYNIPDNIEKVLFLGGEPLITNRHRKFLKKIKNLKNLEVVYNTNGMHKIHNDDIVLLKQCKRVEFIISIDGYGEVNEKVRKYSQWKTIVETINDIITNKFNLTIHTTIHRNNWDDLPTLSKWIAGNNYAWTTNVLTYPKELDVAQLNNEDKINLMYILENYTIPNSSYIKDHLDGN